MLEIIEKLNIDINKQKNTRTQCPPILLFEKEKEYLRPLVNARLLDSYEDVMRSCKVPSTFLIDYKGAKYSVPPYLITKTVQYKEVGDKLYIYYKDELVAIHEISESKTINYDEEHYKSGLAPRSRNDSDIDELARKNLARFKTIGEK